VSINLVSAGLAQYHAPRRIEDATSSDRASKDRRQQGQAYARPAPPTPDTFEAELHVAGLRLGSVVDYRV
jgi:hypothetical protein